MGARKRRAAYKHGDRPRGPALDSAGVATDAMVTRRSGRAETLPAVFGALAGAEPGGGRGPVAGRRAAFIRDISPAGWPTSAHCSRGTGWAARTGWRSSRTTGRKPRSRCSASPRDRPACRSVRTPRRSWTAMLRITGAKALLAPAGATERLREAAGTLGLTLLEGLPEDGVSRHLYESGSPAAEAEPDDVALILRTSGTTGAPKLVPATHRQLAARAWQAREALGIGPGDRCLCPMPALLRTRPLLGADGSAAHGRQRDPSGAHRRGHLPRGPRRTGSHLVHGRPDPPSGDPRLAAPPGTAARRPSPALRSLRQRLAPR